MATENAPVEVVLWFERRNTPMRFNAEDAVEGEMAYWKDEHNHFISWREAEGDHKTVFSARRDSVIAVRIVRQT